MTTRIVRRGDGLERKGKSEGEMDKIMLYVDIGGGIVVILLVILVVYLMARRRGPVMKRCTQCGRQFQTGVNGIGGSQMPALCDACAGIQRDSKGYIWKPGESEQTLEDAWTGAVTTVTRDEAFGRAK